jgi:hypothetical protein
MQARTIVRTVIPALVAIAGLLMAGCASPDGATVFQWPDVPLGKGERIVAAAATFKCAQPVSIQRMPAGWNLGTGDAEAPWGKFSGSIGVGAAALGSTRELPAITIRPSVAGAAEIVTEVVIFIQTYPEGTAPDREVMATVKTPIPRPDAKRQE